MKLNLRRVISSAAVLAIAGGVMASAAGVATAATTPPWEPDPNALGSLTFYNSSGQVITGGSNLSNLAAYIEASTPDTSGGTKATLYFADPTPGEPTGSWFNQIYSTATNFPNASAPAPLNTATNPVITLAATDADLSEFIAASQENTATGYANVYQVRLETSGPGGVGTAPNGQYWEDDILVNPTAGTWSVEYPAVEIGTTTTLTSSPTTGTVGVAETLSAATTAADGSTQAGSVEFLNGTTVIGTDAVNGSGVATQSFTPTAQGTASLSAVFTPTNTGYSSSTGTLSQTVNPAATPTTTSLTVTQDGVAGDDVSLSSTVSPATAPGTVSWYDNGSTTPLNATPVTPNGSGVATFDIPAGLAAGNHSIVADFTPTNPANFEASASAAQSFLLEPKQTGACAQTGSQCTATANISATVPVGTLVLSTPYTAANPLNLGNLALNAGLTQYSATAPISGITIVDTRAGDLPWTLSALASNLSDGGTNPGSTICSQNVGLTNVASTPGTGFAGTVTPSTNTAASPPVAPAGGVCTGSQGLGGATAHTVAAASAGLGTDVLNGTLTLNAPTSTEPGLFTGTITFTVG
jgi:hypothetical protein